MIVQQKDTIEQQSATVLLASPFSNNVRLQGQLHDILLAKNIIDTLLQAEQIPATQSEANSKPKLQRKASNKPAESSGPFTSAIGKDDAEFGGNKEQVVSVAKPMLLRERTGLGQQEAGITEKYMQEHLNNLGIQTSVAQLQVDSDSDSSDYSDDEASYEEITKDPEYKNKVEFAFKLGYKEADLLQALRKVGNQGSQNELLSELIKQGASKCEGGGEESDGSHAQSPGNSVDMLDFGIQQRRSHLDKSNNFRHIIIDGSNVAMSHGNKEVFSCMGIQLAVDWFRARGHTDITVFVPQWRKETSRPDARIKDQAILNQLEKDKILVFTPARRIGGKRVVCYDDRYILKLAVETDGIVVSNDNYRDLIGEKEEFKKVIEERLLMYSFVNDRFMPPDDPLGRSGPTLDNFLLIQPSEPEPLPPPCPYGSKKCTYGNKCKYYHPERRNQPHKTVTERLAEQARQRMQEMKDRATQPSNDGSKKKLSRKTSLQRTSSMTPAEVEAQSLLTFMPELVTGDLGDMGDDKYVEYNQKLRENRLKMEQDQARTDTPCFGEGQIQSPERNVELRSRGSDYNERQSSPRWTGLDNRKPGLVSSREASPVNLAVPGHPASLEGGEQFISGHLLLAKKLSDEANESDKLKKMEKLHESGSSSPSSSQQFQRTVSRQSPDSKKTKPKQPVIKQKLSRQLSLQGGEDPRLRQGHSSLRAQYSYDPRLVPSQSLFYTQDNSSDNSLLKDFMNSQAYEGCRDIQSVSMPGSTSQGQFGAIGQGLPSHLSHDAPRAHMSLSRMQSAPVPHPSMIHQQQQRQAPTMMRQNSNSDTQLNKLDDVGFIGERMMHHSGHDMLISRGSVPMKDKSGSLTFKIGGAPPSRQPLQHYSSMGSLTQGCQNFGPSEQDYMFQQQQQQQHLSQTYSDIPQSRMPFMQTSHTNLMPQTVQPNYGNLRSSPTFVLSQPIHDPSQLINQPGLWATSQYQSDSVPSSMSGLNMPTSSMPAQHFSSRSQANPHPLIQHQFSMPIPEDRPILADDPRYKLYFHLCGLFPEEKVRVVMNQHPDNTNASEICAYIIGAG